MTIGRCVYAAIALAVAGTPRFAEAMGLGNAPPVVSTPGISPLNGGVAPAGATLLLQCTATDDGAVGTLVAKVFAGADLTASPLFTSGNLVAAAAANVTGSTNWTAPPTPASYTVVCQATDAGWPAATSSSSLAFSTAITAPPPTVDSLTASAAEAFPGDTIELQATAHGTAITYQWSATGGAITGSGSQVTWTAPSQSGVYIVTVTVTDSAGLAATRNLTLSSVWAKSAASVSANELSFPRRVALDACGSILVTDPRLSAVEVLSSTGQVLQKIRVYGEPAGVAVGPGGRILVSDVTNRAVRIYSPRGKPVGFLGAGPGEFQAPVDVAVTPDGTAWVADAGAQQVKAYDGGGRLLRAFAVSGHASGIAVDPVGGRIFLSDSLSSQVLVYGLAGNAVGTIGAYGTGGGGLVRAGGVALGSDGNVYVADAYQAVLQVFTPTGGLAGIVGGYGRNPGQLDIPLGVTADSHGHVLVASTQTGRIESYALRNATASAPAGTAGCVLRAARGGDDDDEGDRDDRDGHRWGIARRTADDGPSQSKKSRSGASATTTGAPTTGAAGSSPVLIASSKMSSGPGLVRLSTSLQSRAACSVSWSQVAGPPVKLRGGNTLTPSFVGRTAGTYGFRGEARCGTAGGATALAQATIFDVAPIARAAATQVVTPGDAFALDGDASSDANGDPPSLRWEQTLGAPVFGAAQGARVVGRARKPGLLGFELVATDPAGHQAAEDVNVLVVPSGQVAPTAIVMGGGVARAGSPVTLDASRSIVAAGSQPRFVWTQLAGAPVAIDGGGGGVLQFVPDEPGQYAFEVSVAAGGIVSPPARVDVYASGPAGLPTARAIAPATAAVGLPLQLDGSGSAPAAGGALSFRWRQVAGPAAGLNDDDRAMATAVAFEPGVYAFELAVREANGESLPSRVQVLVTGTSPLPVALVRSWRDDEVVTLDGRESRSGSGAALRYQWTQVGGPWTPLEGAASPTVRFHPLVPGVYRFELVVIDGAVRSAPAAVQVTVGEGGEER